MPNKKFDEVSLPNHKRLFHLNLDVFAAVRFARAAAENGDAHHRLPTVRGVFSETFFRPTRRHAHSCTVGIGRSNGRGRPILHHVIEVRAFVIPPNRKSVELLKARIRHNVVLPPLSKLSENGDFQR